MGLSPGDQSLQSISVTIGGGGSVGLSSGDQAAPIRGMNRRGGGLPQGDQSLHNIGLNEGGEGESVLPSEDQQERPTTESKGKTQTQPLCSADKRPHLQIPGPTLSRGGMNGPLTCESMKKTKLYVASGRGRTRGGPSSSGPPNPLCCCPSCRCSLC